MKRTAVIAHLCIPAVLALGVFAMVLRNEPLRMEIFVAYVVMGYLFYAAPHLLWAVVATLFRFSNAVWHAGFLASNIALAAVALFWLFPRDPSGLPMQWLLYWPLAIVLLIVLTSLTAVYKRVHKRSNNTQPTPTSGAIA